MEITGAQCRAARALLNISQLELALKSKISKRTIAQFEGEAANVLPSMKEGLKRTLESCGITFTARGVELSEKVA